MSEKSGTGEGRGGFLREGFEGRREGKMREGFAVAFSSYRLWWRGGGGICSASSGFFFDEDLEIITGFPYEEEEDYM